MFELKMMKESWRIANLWFILREKLLPGLRFEPGLPVLCIGVLPTVPLRWITGSSQKCYLVDSHCPPECCWFHLSLMEDTYVAIAGNSGSNSGPGKNFSLKINHIEPTRWLLWKPKFQLPTCFCAYSFRRVIN